jgi:hypothetical protein
VEDDLLRDRLLEWLETHNTVTEKAPTAESPDKGEVVDEEEAEAPTAPDDAKKASKDKQKKKEKEKEKADKGKEQD